MVYNIGIYKECQHNSKSKCYKVWKDMLQRCYNNKTQDKYPTYKGCKVCESWLTFKNFADWFDDNYIERYQIDKDIIGNGKLYSLDTCCFVPNKINNLLHTNSKKKQSNLPMGVRLQDGKYRVIINIGINKKRHIGYFDNIHEAERAYLKAKREYVLSIINNYALSDKVKTLIKERT
jgi:hypothetical protein